MTFVHATDPGRKPLKTMTQAQIDARNRNWYIRKLRAYFHLCPIREGERGKQIQAIVDAEIISLGAESEIEREAKRAKEWEKLCQ